uniref:Band 7 domain-containing protein n=1 Tax=Odontella aurita TaxID=265563 RepID=A0A7S4NII5_9STRA|mmetsp:Transcript_9156/g.27526  ORF Transcript_9156/g.27526 Transcript_9156/m.27526 type:complete len:601 (+) Transcript_9156:441-2243(+)
MAYYAPTETLSSADIPTTGSANVWFGSDTSLLVARPGKPCCSFPLFWFTVPEGFYALVTRHGATELYQPPGGGDPTPVWPPGLHLGPPWMKVSHLVTKQSVVFNTPIRGCKTKDNVTVNIDVALVLRIMGGSDSDGGGGGGMKKGRREDPWNVYKFVHEVTARGLQQQLADAQAEAVRTLARSVLHTEVFGLRNVGNQEMAGLRSGLYGTSVAPNAPGGEESQRAAAALIQQMGMGMGTIMEAPEGGGAEETKEEMGMVDEELGEVGRIAAGGVSTPSERQRTQEDKDLIGEHDEYDPLEAGFNVEAGASITDAMRARLNRQFVPQGVEILDVVIQQITLPDEIQTQMSQKTMVISQNAEQRMQQKHDMQVLNQREAIKTLRQSIDERKMEIQKDGELLCLRERMELEREKAGGEAVEWSVSTQMVVDVDLVSAENALTVQRIRDATRLETERTTKEAEAKSAVSRCAAEAKVREVDAEAEAKYSELQAQGDKALFHAEGISAPKNRTLHEHTTSLLRLRAQDALASNDQLVITGTSGGKAANRMLLADAALSGLPQSRGGAVSAEERSALLSELAVASGRADVRLHVGAGGGASQGGRW